MASFASKSVFRTGIATLAVLFSAASALANGNYSLNLNKTEIVRLPENAGAVVIGNPEIADVTVHSANTLFVVGRGYGETNLIVLNNSGHTIMDANIQVINKLSPHGVRLYNGKLRESYSCVPYCMPSPILGDDPAFIGINSGEAKTINNSSSTALPTPSSNFGTPQSTTSSSSSTQPSPEPTSFGSGTNFNEF